MGMAMARAGSEGPLLGMLIDRDHDGSTPYAPEFVQEIQDTRRQLFEDLELYLADNCQAWVLQSDGNYVREEPADREPVAAQARLLQALAV